MANHTVSLAAADAGDVQIMSAFGSCAEFRNDGWMRCHDADDPGERLSFAVHGRQLSGGLSDFPEGHGRSWERLLASIVIDETVAAIDLT
jgi:hypothetical protein